MATLIELRCKNCGGLLSGGENEEISCPFCGAHYIISSTEHVSSEVEEAIRNAEYVMLVFGEYEKAYRLFREIIDKDPSNYRGYLGILKAMTKCFTDVKCYENYYVNIEIISEYVRKLYLTASGEKLSLYKQSIDPFIKRVERHKQLKKELSDIESEIKETQKKAEWKKSDVLYPDESRKHYAAILRGHMKNIIWNAAFLIGLIAFNVIVYFYIKAAKNIPMGISALLVLLLFGSIIGLGIRIHLEGWIWTNIYDYVLCLRVYKSRDFHAEWQSNKEEYERLLEQCRKLEEQRQEYITELAELEKG